MKRSQTLLLLLLTPFATARIGDHIPFCLFPYQFGTSLKPINKKISLEKYQGKWYEISRLDAPFQKDCLCSSATYTLSDDKSYVNVYNFCNTKSGGTKDVTGKAYTEVEDNNQLMVYFNPVFGGNYWIMDIDEEYKHVLVGEPCRRFMWVLAREKTADPKVYERFMGVAKNWGFDVSKLVHRDKSC